MNIVKKETINGEKKLFIKETYLITIQIMITKMASRN